MNYSDTTDSLSVPAHIAKYCELLAGIQLHLPDDILKNNLSAEGYIECYSARITSDNGKVQYVDIEVRP